MEIMSTYEAPKAPLVSQTPEVMRKIAMGEIVRKILVRLSLEQPSLKNFNVGERAHKIDSVSAAIKGLGQLTSSISSTVHQEVISSQH